MESQQAILGIDLGSTSSRAFLLCPARALEIPVTNKERNNLSGRYELGDFPSICYPFDDKEPVYLEGSSDASRLSISLKYAFYLLTNSSDNLLTQYALIAPLMERKKDPVFLARLRLGLERLFCVVRLRVNQICSENCLAITSIALSIPTQWDLEFEAVYQDLIARVFSHPSSEIYFFTETEALAHYLFKNHFKSLQCSGEEDVLLFLDFGGHNMNGCTFNVVYGENGASSFYRIEESFGVGGGSEQWEYYIGEFCSRRMEQLYKQPLSPHNKQRFLDTFNQEKRSLGPGQQRSVELLCYESGAPWYLDLQPATINDAFEGALRGPLRMAKAQIARLSKFDHVNRRVIVSGGTCRNESLQSRLKEFCKDASLPEPIFTDTFEITYESIKIARGAAYAAGNTLTVANFLNRGAAFGLQVRQSPTYGNNNPEGFWDNSACFLLDKKGQVKQKFFATGRDEVKIVCDPFCPGPNNEDTMLHHNKCYDFLPLGKPTRGWWYYDLSFSEGGSPQLVLQRSKRSLKTSTVQKESKATLPLFFDKGTNCIHVGSRGLSLEELGLDFKVEAASCSNSATERQGVKPSGSLRSNQTDPREVVRHGTVG